MTHNLAASVHQRLLNYARDLDGRDPQGEICRCFTQIQRIFVLT